MNTTPIPPTAKKRISSLDVFIVLLLILCLIGFGVRLYLGEDGMLPEKTPESEKYIVSFLISDIKTSIAENYFSSGDTFLLESGEVFGTLTDDPLSINPAEYYIENASGALVKTVANPNAGDDKHSDIRGTVEVSGYMSERGFLVNGKVYAAPNCEIEVMNENITVKLTLIDIKKQG